MRVNRSGQRRHCGVGDDSAPRLFDHRRQSAVVGDDDGKTDRHRFQHRHGVRLAYRREHIDIRGGHPPGNGIGGQRTLPGDARVSGECGAQRGPFPLIVADQRESRVDTGVEQFLRHLHERDRTFPRMHPGGEQNLRPSGRRAQPWGSAGHRCPSATSRRPGPATATSCSRSCGFKIEHGSVRRGAPFGSTPRPAARREDGLTARPFHGSAGGKGSCVGARPPPPAGRLGRGRNGCARRRIWPSCCATTS